MNETQRPDPALAAEEDRRIRELQRTMDLALFYIEIAPIPLEKAGAGSEVKSKALRLFPTRKRCST
jgi:hypothetical protein